MFTRKLITMRTSLAAFLDSGARLARHPQAASAQAAPPAPAAAPGPLPATPVVGSDAPNYAGLESGIWLQLPDRAAPTIEGIEPEAGGLTSKEVARRALAVSPEREDRKKRSSSRRTRRSRRR